jgi:hypothetical protein
MEARSVQKKPPCRANGSDDSARVAAVVSLPGCIDLDSRAERMNRVWKQLVKFQNDDILLVALCTSCER